jgi:hypothetical protein
MHSAPDLNVRLAPMHSAQPFLERDYLDRGAGVARDAVDLVALKGRVRVGGPCKRPRASPPLSGPRLPMPISRTRRRCAGAIPHS